MAKLAVAWWNFTTDEKLRDQITHDNYPDSYDDEIRYHMDVEGQDCLPSALGGR